MTHDSLPFALAPSQADDGDAAAVQALENEKTPVPKVDDPEGKWQCAVPKAGGGAEPKEVATVGEFVKVCVLPAMNDRK